MKIISSNLIVLPIAFFNVQCSSALFLISYKHASLSKLPQLMNKMNLQDNKIPLVSVFLRRRLSFSRSIEFILSFNCRLAHHLIKNN